jgi:hypothetical protein
LLKIARIEENMVLWIPTGEGGRSADGLVAFDNDRYERKRLIYTRLMLRKRKMGLKT